MTTKKKIFQVLRFRQMSSAHTRNTDQLLVCVLVNVVEKMTYSTRISTSPHTPLVPRQPAVGSEVGYVLTSIRDLCAGTSPSRLILLPVRVYVRVLRSNLERVLMSAYAVHVEGGEHDRRLEAYVSQLLLVPVPTWNLQGNPRAWTY